MPLYHKPVRALFSKPPPSPEQCARPWLRCILTVTMVISLLSHFTSLQIIASQLRTRMVHICKVACKFKHNTVHEQQTQKHRGSVCITVGSVLALPFTWPHPISGPTKFVRKYLVGFWKIPSSSLIRGTEYPYERFVFLLHVHSLIIGCFIDHSPGGVKNVLFTESRQVLRPTTSPIQWILGCTFTGGKAIRAWSWSLTCN